MEENIFKADVIAWVRPPTASGKSQTIPSEDGVAPTYRPLAEFQFEVVEYLKGSGGNSLTVESPQRHTYLTANEAVDAANNWLSGQSAGYDNHNAVVFLRIADGGASSSQTYYFESRTSDVFDQTYSAYKEDNAWLSASEAKPANSAASPTFLADAEPSATGLISLTLDDLRARVKAVDTMLKKGEGIDGYEDCIAFRFIAERTSPMFPENPKAVESGPFDSGLAAGTEIYNASFAGVGFTKHWLVGTDAELFQIVTVVDGEDIVPDYSQTRNQRSFYTISTRVARPVPGGRYNAKKHIMADTAIPCNYYDPDPELARTWIFTFESPAGALHEAFFDPASIGIGGEAAVGADASNGVLKPTDFTFGGAGVSLDSIKWQSQAVEMRLSPHNRLANHHADFIALDGSVSLRLDFDDATETGEGGSLALSWPVCAQPWRDGDLLMLRISESPTDLSGVSRDGDCVSGTATAAPTATAVPSTPTPTATPIPDTPTVAPELDTPTPAP